MEISATSVSAIRPGKSAQSVGHMAKAAVLEARAAGAELPKNAQGVAASAIARGADPASVFAALITPPDPVVEEPAVEDGAEPLALADEDINIGFADAGYGSAAAIMDGSETALALLEKSA